ncbi:MAG: DNA topoisomerase 4 subunit A [Clostridia bacterium]|jgi:DNA gyrase subunit A|nr:DNA topoisomerase 4 subunit A [Clostridia bacterium]
MAKRKKDEIINNEVVTPISLGDVMHDSMLPFAEYVIMDRALPRVEDGLKPVQRRILYTMMELSLLPEKPHRKSARIVGDALGKYHPHGDKSVYDAMVRMAQSFVMRAPLVSGHGNFGSMDGDTAAAMRYTEARLSPIAMELLAHIHKDTVRFSFNFDDTLKEPDMLPARYPNLLVNGASGIAVGLATNIPPHNLVEVIDGVVARIKNPTISLDEIMQIIKGPDFPTGGYLLNMEQLRQAYETGRGKVAVRAKATIEKGTNGKTLIVINEIAYQINKAAMLRKILLVTETRKDMFAGIADIRDESDRTGIRAVIEVRKGFDTQDILTCLYKYSDMQVTFGINMVCIADGQPKQLSLMQMIDYYIAFQKDVVTRRTRFDLEKARRREHILAGLMISVQNIDEVIKIIRGSESPKVAKAKLIERFKLSDVQAQAILDMRLARLTELEIDSLQKEYAFIQETIKRLEAILKSNAMLLKVIVHELTEIRDKYGDPRRTKVLDTNHEIEINEADYKTVEGYAILLSPDGFLKRINEKTYQKSALTNGDSPKQVITSASDMRVQIFTSLGNMYTLNCTDLPDAKPKDKGKPLSALMAGINAKEQIVGLFSFSDYKGGDIVFATKNGLIKRSKLSDYDVRNKKIAACGLTKDDSIVSVNLISNKSDWLVLSSAGMAVRFSSDDVSCMGRAAKGVKSISLPQGDTVVMACPIAERDDVMILTELGYTKRSKVSQFEIQRRGGKGVRAITLQKNGATGTRVAAALTISTPSDIIVSLNSGQHFTVSSGKIACTGRASKGTPAVLAVMGDFVKDVYISSL